MIEINLLPEDRMPEPHVPIHKRLLNLALSPVLGPINLLIDFLTGLKKGQ